MSEILWVPGSETEAWRRGGGVEGQGKDGHMV
jgi:hypothetical protein